MGIERVCLLETAGIGHRGQGDCENTVKGLNRRLNERECCLCRIKKAKGRFEKYENFSCAMMECKESVERGILIRLNRRGLTIGKVRF